MSVAYRSASRLHVWERPARRGDPSVTRLRGVVGLDELSLVVMPKLPAYDGARVTVLTIRTAAEQRQHDTSQETIREALSAVYTSRGAAGDAGPHAAP